MRYVIYVRNKTFVIFRAFQVEPRFVLCSGLAYLGWGRKPGDKQAVSWEDDWHD